MKKTLLSLSIAAAAVSVPAQAADIGGGFDLSGNLALSSNYIWRGATLSNDRPVVSGGFDLAHESGFYIGTWASSEGAAANAEVDLYGGFSTSLGALDVDLGYITYNYPGNSDANFEDVAISLGTSAGAIDLGASYYYGVDSALDYWDVSAGTDIGGIGVAASYGDYEDTGSNYTFTVSKEILSASWPVEVSLMYYNFDHETTSTSDEDGVVFTVAKSF